MGKLRSDAKLASLSPTRLAEVNEMLLGGSSLEDVRDALLTADEIAISKSALSNYYQTHVHPIKIARGKAAQEGIREAFAGCDDYDDVTRKVLSQSLFDLLVQPEMDLKAIRAIGGLVVQGKSQELDDRKLKLLEIKAAQAEAAKAALEAKVASGGISEETMATIEETLKLL